jgi:hypothetical protein
VYKTGSILYVLWETKGEENITDTNDTELVAISEEV